MYKIPSPPHPYIVHPYALGNVFIGQKDRLMEISSWYKQGRLLLIDAPGGMGKTALVWHWLENNPDKTVTAGNVLWWSFYEGGATFDAFLVHAVAYLTGIHIETLYLWDRTKLQKELIKNLSKNPLLFILDGMERLLIAYHRLDAPRLPDSTVDDNEAKKIKRMRAFTDPGDPELISSILKTTKTKIIATSRIIPLDFEDDSIIRQNMKRISLEGLGDNDAIELLERLGCFAEKKDLKDILNICNNNTLLINLLGAAVFSDKIYEGNLTNWKEYFCKYGESVIDYAYDQLPATIQELLCKISAFRFSIPYKAIENISSYMPYIPPPPDKQPDTEKKEASLAELKQNPHSDYLQGKIEEFNKIETAWKIYTKIKEFYDQIPEVIESVNKLKKDLEVLRKRGFLLQNNKADRYDLHPVIRAFAFDKLSKSAAKETFDKIRNYFDALPWKKNIEFISINDLARTIEIYYALVNTERFTEAYELYKSRLEDSLDKASAFATIVMLLKALFPDGLDTLPRINGYRKQSYLVTSISNAMHMIDMSDDALVLKTLAVTMDIEHKALNNLAISLINYGIHLEYEDKISPALEVYNLALRLHQIDEKESKLAYDYFRLVNLLTDIGDIKKAEEASQMYYRFEHAQDSDSAVGITYSRVERLLLQGMYTGEILEKALTELETITEKAGDTFDTYNLLMLKGEIALKNRDWTSARSLFSKASVISGKTGYVEQNSNAGLAVAVAMLGDKERARKMIESIEANTKQYNNIWPELARACLAVGDREKAIKHANRAYKESWAEGGEYTWKSGMLKTKEIFKELNLPEPVLPAKIPDINKDIPFKDKVLDVIKKAECAKKYKKSFTQSDPEFEDYLYPDIHLSFLEIPEKIREIIKTFFPVIADEISLECIGEPVLKAKGIELYVRTVERKDYMISDYLTGKILFLPLDFLYDTRLEIYFKSLAVHIIKQLQKMENGNLLTPTILFPKIQNHPLNNHRINTKHELEKFLEEKQEINHPVLLPSGDIQRNNALEQLILEDPGNNQAYSDLAIWYKKQGYVLGDFIDAQLKEPLDLPVMGPEAQQIFNQVKREITGGLCDYPHVVRLGWKKGLIDRLSFYPDESWYDEEEVASFVNLFEYAIKHPAAFSVKNISLGPVEYLDKFLNVLIDHKPGAVKTLVLGDPFEGYDEPDIEDINDDFLSDLPAAFPRLEKLMLQTSNLRLPELIFPDLQVLIVFSIHLDKRLLNAFENGYLRNLRKLKLWYNKSCFFNEEEIFEPTELITRIADNTGLRELTLHKSDWGDELVYAILDSGLLSGLNTLDLAMGTITDRGAKLLMENKDLLKSISRINLSDNYLSDKMTEQIKNLCPEVITASQKEIPVE